MITTFTLASLSLELQWISSDDTKPISAPKPMSANMPTIAQVSSDMPAFEPRPDEEDEEVVRNITLIYIGLDDDEFGSIAKVKEDLIELYDVEPSTVEPTPKVHTSQSQVVLK
ncbi:hypothetical protein L6452_06143 [Arctium lappa]|uniref:Uncharacterized protein n=1 Tax=Arctium lappa TaxID=4217 RepID=A0ACB9EJD9_ARCLA|nr:hypothetical protein L6452_06143 [Arctium lappa]